MPDLEVKNQNNTFVRQAAILASAGLITRLIGFLYRLPLTHMIGDEGNGIYAAGFYFYTLFLILSSAGLPAAISKMVSERYALKQYKNAKRVFYVSLVFAAVLGFIFSLALYFGAGILSKASGVEESQMAIMVLSPTVFIVAIMAVFRGYFQGMKNSVPTALSQIVEQVFNAAFSLILAYFFMQSVKGGENEIAMGAAGGTAGTGVGALFGLATVLAIYFMAKPNFDRKINRDKSSFQEAESNILKELLKTAFPIIIGTAIFSFANFIDMFTVTNCLKTSGVFSEKEITALYGQLTGKYVVFTTLPAAISTSLATAAIPDIAASFKLKNTAEAKRKISSAIRVAMVLSVPSAVGLGVLGDPILKLLFPNYSDGAVLLSVGAVSIIFLSLAQIITGVLQSMGKVNIPVIGAILGVLVKIPLNYILISNPDINVVGAVIGTIGCYLVASLFDWFMMCRYTKTKPEFMGVLVKPLIASAAMGISCYSAYYMISYITHSNTISTLGSILLAIIVYFFFMILLRGIKKDDLRGIPFSGKISRFLI